MIKFKFNFYWFLIKRSSKKKGQVKKKVKLSTCKEPSEPTNKERKHWKSFMNTDVLIKKKKKKIKNKKKKKKKKKN